MYLYLKKNNIFFVNLLYLNLLCSHLISSSKRNFYNELYSSFFFFFTKIYNILFSKQCPSYLQTIEYYARNSSVLHVYYTLIFTTEGEIRVVYLPFDFFLLNTYALMFVLPFNTLSVDNKTIIFLLENIW